MTDSMFPTIASMNDAAVFFLTFVAWGIGISVVFWLLGYLVWFIIQFFR